MMNKTSSKTAFPAPKHNHDQCLGAAIDKARKLFAYKKLRLTPLREEIYRQILASHNAMSAYQLLDKLNRNERNFAPITIYRILDLLRDMGLIHRLESQNTYYACYQNHQKQNSHISLICRGCGTIAELLDETIEKAFELLEQEADFLTKHRVLEIEGFCPKCRQTEQQKC